MTQILTKKQAKMIQGIAVTMMLFHHFFQKPENLTLLHFFNADLCMRISWLCKLCVAMFAFVSGYGLYSALDKNNAPDIPALYKASLKRIFRLYTSLWLVIVIAKLIDFFYFHIPINFKELILNALGISYSYNGTWWYVLFYVIISLLFPLICYLLSDKVSLIKKAILLLIICAGIGAFYYAGQHVLYPYIAIAFMFMQVAMHPPILLSFLFGILISKFMIYERLYFITKLLPLIAILILSIIRIKLATSAAYITWDFLMVPILIPSLILLVKPLKKSEGIISGFFTYIGRYSTFMWLTHSLISGYTYYFVARITKIVPIYFAVEFALTLAVSILLSLIHNKISNIN